MGETNILRNTVDISKKNPKQEELFQYNNGELLFQTQIAKNFKTPKYLKKNNNQ